MIRYEKTELTRSLDLGRFDAWKVQAAHIDPDRPLVLFDFEPHRVYSPLEHSELPHAFACVISIGIDDRPETDSYDAEALKHFVSTFGRLGWVEAKRNAQQGDHLIFETQDLVAAALNEFGRINAAADRERHRMMTHFAEPIRWVVGHASVVWWCLRAAEALQVSQKRARESACEWIAERVPDQDGQLPILVARRRPGGFSCSDYVGACLAETLTGKVQWVRRRVDYLGNGTLRSLWGGSSLIDSIYTLIADAVTGGRRVARCEECGAAFIQSDERQRFCPPWQGETKSRCMNRHRVRAYRKQRKVQHRRHRGKTRKG